MQLDILKSSGIIFCYISPTWNRSPSCSRSPTSTRSPKWTGITLRCDLSSPGHSTVLYYVGTLFKVGILVGVGILV